MQDLLRSMNAKDVILDKQDYRIGKTKIFLKPKAGRMLDERRSQALGDLASRLQRVARMYIAKKRYNSYKKLLSLLLSAMIQRNEELLEIALSETGELPHAGVHLVEVQDARKLQAKFREERRITHHLREAIENKDISALRSGLEAMNGINASSESGLQAKMEAIELIEKIEGQKQLKADLASFTYENRAWGKLTKTLKLAEEKGATDLEEYKHALALKNRIEEESTILNNLVAAVNSRRLDELLKGLSQATYMGLENPQIQKARETRDDIRDEEQVLEALKYAIESQSLNALKSTLQRAEGRKMYKTTLVREAKDLRKKLEKEAQAIKNVALMSSKQDLKGLAAALSKAESLGLESRRYTVLLEGESLKRRLEERDQCNENLMAYARTEDLERLQVELTKAAELGITSGSAIHAANEMLKKKASKNKKLEWVSKIQQAITDGDADTLQSLISSKAAAQHKNDDVYREANESLKRLLEEQQIVNGLVESMGLLDVKAMQAGLELANKFDGFSSRHHFTFEKAKQILKAYELVEAAIVSREWDMVTEAVQAVHGCGGQRVGIFEEIYMLKRKMEREQSLIEEIREALVLARAQSAESMGVKQQISRTKTQGGNLIRVGSKRTMKVIELLEQVPSDMPDNDIVRDAIAYTRREAVIEDIMRLILEAGETSDISKLNEATAKIIELGLRGPDVDACIALRDQLENQREIINALNAQVNSVRIKSKSKDGLQSQDLRVVEVAIDVALTAGLPHDNPDILKAEEFRKYVLDHLNIQEELQNALQSQDFGTLRLAMDHAQENDVNTELAAKVRQLVRQMDATRRDEQKDAFKHGDEDHQQGHDITEEELERQREAKLARADHTRYAFANYHKIRSDEDFAKGSIFNKREVIEKKLKHQNTLIPKSILMLDKQLSKIAVKIHKDILGYCGDKSMSFLPTLAHDILTKGINNPEIIDEIYIQLCKQLTRNPRVESIGRAWQLMCMCSGTFPPSVGFEYYLLNFIALYLKVPGLIGNYARYSMRRLEGIVNMGATGFVPSVEELASYKTRPPILVSIDLVSPGTPLTRDVPITPDMNVRAVLNICLHFLGLQKYTAVAELYGIFVVDIVEEKRELEERALKRAGGELLPAVTSNSKLEKDNITVEFATDSGSQRIPANEALAKSLYRTPRPLKDDEFLGDIIVQMTKKKHDFRLLFQRKLYIKNFDHGQEYIQEPLYRRLVYMQALDEFVAGNVYIDDVDDVIDLVAAAVAADNEHFPKSIEQILQDAQLMNYFPTRFRKMKPERFWARAVLARGLSFENEPHTYLQDRFVDVCKRSPLFGAVYFNAVLACKGSYVDGLPKKLTLAVNGAGIHFLDYEDESRKVIKTAPFRALRRWGGSNRLFTITIVVNKSTKESFDFSVSTAQALHLSDIMHDYVKAIAANDQRIGST